MLMQDRLLFIENPDVNVRIPQTTVIGTDEYDYFIEKNNIQDAYNNNEEIEKLQELAYNGRLSDGLREKLYTYIQHVDSPLSVRSSSLFEDSISQPFSGIYETYFLPNNHPDINVRLKHLEEAIKLVYASVYSNAALSYFEAINYKVGEEKMAILLQRVVGHRFDTRFYPHISGVAQSYNYYPVSYLQPMDGIAIIGFGLGNYVVDGEKAWRFCPKYPKLEFVSQDDLLKETQVSFYALNMEENNINLLEGSDSTLLRLYVNDVEKDGTLDYCASVWDTQSNSLKVGPGYQGPKVMNFASILKYDYFPLSQILDESLEVIRNAMGMPVEIEFAVDLDKGPDGKPSLYILQAKPILGDLKDYNLNLEDIDKEELLLYTEMAMGNGTVDDLCDIIYVDEQKFDRSKTIELVQELDQLNKEMRKEKKRYILIGPGRWGSRDHWLGVPVRWANISNARIIVETELEDFCVDASLGSHFFHNITSKNIGYLHIPYGSDTSFIDWQWLEKQPVAGKTEHFIHVRVDKPLLTKMDGRKSITVIHKA
jgi:hypothetical protein